LWEKEGNYRAGGASVATYSDIHVKDLIQSGLFNEVELTTKSKLSLSKNINTILITERAQDREFWLQLLSIY